MTSSSLFERPARRRVLGLAMAAGLSVTLSGCFPLAAGSLVMGTLAATDRRTLGAQTDDQAIELKTYARLRERLGPLAKGISVTSFNRKVLLTGQAADPKARVEAEAIAAGVENVRGVVNELAATPALGLGTASNDAYLSTRVKAALVDVKEVSANSIKVVTEDSVVYLMGLVTEMEGRVAAEVSSRVSGVRRVVKVFEYITQAEYERLNRTPAPPESQRKSG